MRTSTEGVSLLKQLEGCRLKAYQCSAGRWTIGYGFTDGVQEGDTMTAAECEARLGQELVIYEQAVWQATGGNVSQNEFDALVLFTWNVGIAGMRGSSVIKAHNRGDKVAASRAFGLWNKAGGQVNKGLVSRRAAEAALYLTPDIPPAVVDMPQEVTPEKPLSDSTTIIAGGTAGLATMTQIAEQIGKFKDGIDGVGNWLVPSLLVITLIAVGWVIYERFKNRSRGAI